MRLFAAALTILLATAGIQARELATLPEILALMDSSPVKYAIKEDRDARFDLRQADFSRPEANPEWRVVRDAEGVAKLDTFQNAPCAKRDLIIAAVALEQEEFHSSLLAYKRAYACDTANFKLLTYIGNIHFFLSELDSAQKYLRASLVRNPLDYQAHFFLSDVYRNLGDTARALDEFIEALYLNRNGMGLRKYGLALLDPLGLEIDEDMYRFGFEVTGSAGNGVVIALADMGDIGIATTIAAWRHDPSYQADRAKPGYEAEMYWNAIANQAIYWATDKKISKSPNPRQRRFIELLESRLLKPAVYWEYASNVSPSLVYLARPEARAPVLEYIRKHVIRKQEVPK